ncbi:hypothetical protein MCOR27_007234 [Pyricularia oryzae]|uniref:Pectate lyase superfamily protein domain-containing protein n=1 Tax=Pyricularia oryzae TaxID=318829 RepID=A0A4P7NVN3_PYROR|nr:hypothetical protein MCOR02_001122 [Pyricularia oryzae]KAI6274864.1 hypothetical protein MCOR27_007234 [Pyricularia oryzae]KAI6318105.1 hypothetical protein MCOR34_003757 [Pyricularia oryzae]KAI6474357.1 hypothetical protein MCOR17_002163 [Pyricularia oryzae]KAI6504570.1 hypothetical protein MCOR13_004814 [Pyricularia oryzae]
MFYQTGWSRMVAVASLCLLTIANAKYVSYPRPSIYTKSAHFSLKVNGTYVNTTNYAGYDYVHISMDQGYRTEFRIAITDQPAITSYTISPQRLPIQARVEGKELIFSLVKAHYLIVRLNDSKNTKGFVVMIDPIEENVPQPRGNGIYNVLDYKADDTGASLNTGIQSALDAAGARPGSIVYVPPGLYLTGNLVLPSRTSLYLAGGAVLRFTGVMADYKMMYKKSDLFPGTWWITTEPGSVDVKVYGRGTIDGNGEKTRDNKFMASMLVPSGTTNFRVDGVLVRDSSFWGVVAVQSEGVYMVNLKVLNRFGITQNDGVDVCESTRVTVRRSIAVAKDDSFSTKTWPEDTGTTVPYPYAPRPLADVVFEDCLAWTECFGYKVGEGVWQRQSNVTFRDSVVHRAGVGLGVHHKFGTAAADSVTFDNIDIENLGGSPGGFASWLIAYVNNVNSGVGPITRLVVSNIRARKQGGRDGYLQGNGTSSMVSDVTFRNVYMGDSKTPAKSLKEMNILRTAFSEKIKISNS